MLLLTWASENPSHEPSILPALLKLKVAIVVITALQRNKRRNTSFIELDGDESKCCVKVDTFEILIYPLGEMGHMPMWELAICC